MGLNYASEVKKHKYYTIQLSLLGRIYIVLFMKKKN